MQEVKSMQPATIVKTSICYTLLMF